MDISPCLGLKEKIIFEQAKNSTVSKGSERLIVFIVSELSEYSMSRAID